MFDAHALWRLFEIGVWNQVLRLVPGRFRCEPCGDDAAERLGLLSSVFELQRVLGLAIFSLRRDCRGAEAAISVGMRPKLQLLAIALRSIE